MAKRRFAIARVKPIVIRTTKFVKKHAKRHYHGGGRGLFEGKRMGVIAAGGAIGMLLKSGIQVPEIPLLGQAGTIGLAAHLLSGGGRNKFFDELTTASLTIAAFELVTMGKVVGEEDYVAGF